MKQRTSYSNTPSHLQLDPDKAKCPCGKKAVAFWIQTETGKMLGFECEDGHLFDIDLADTKKAGKVITKYA